MMSAAIVFAVALVLGLSLPELAFGAVPDAIVIACASAGAAFIATRLGRPAPASDISPGLSLPPTAAFLRELRHDLRGILSPALMMADRLLMASQDPLAKRCAETMIETIERAERRLSSAEPSAPQADG